MAGANIIKDVLQVSRRLSITREAELLQSFVRVNVVNDEDEKVETTEETDGELKTAAEQKVAKNKDKKTSSDEKMEEVMANKQNKKRRRRNGGNHKREELYCDKDRAAAVNMGSKDIKQSLKLKRKQDRSKALQIPEEAEPGTFLALGVYEMSRGDLKIALNFIVKALELNPNDKNAMVARSRCYILLGKADSALKDAEAALAIERTFLMAIYQKAEALYYLGDFEYSLVFFHRGLHIRPDHSDFKLGVYKSQRAIENSIGYPNVFSKFLHSHNSGNKPGHCRNSKRGRTNSKNTTDNFDNVTQATVKGPNSKSSQSHKREKRSESISEKSDSAPAIRRSKSAVRTVGVTKNNRMLRQLAPDKEYLGDILKNPNLQCKVFNSNPRNNKMESTIKEAVEYLNARQKFWRQQLPDYLK